MMDESNEKAREYDICATCGHYRFLHRSSFQGDCDACDDPSMPLAERCKHFQEKGLTLT